MSPESQFDRLDTSWDAQVLQCTATNYQIGPFVVQICYTSPSFEKFIRAFSHLKLADTETPYDLSIRLWDVSTSGYKLPLLDWNFLRSIPYSGCRLGSLYLQWFEYIDVLSVLHMDRKRAYYVVRNAQELPWWTQGAPLQVILQAYLQHQGLQLTHTAAVGNGQKAILLSGKGGQGKSTTTLACLHAGMQYLGEDYSILQPGKSSHVFSIYHSARWEPYTRALFPTYESWIMNKDKTPVEKAQVFYQNIFPEQIQKSSPIQAVVALSIGTQELPMVQPVNSHETLQSLMLSTIKQLPFCGAQTMRILQEVIHPLPQYKLVLGTNLNANVDRILDLL